MIRTIAIALSGTLLLAGCASTGGEDVAPQEVSVTNISVSDPGAYMDSQEQAFRDQLKDTGVTIIRTPKYIALVFPSSITFETDKYDIVAEFTPALDTSDEERPWEVALLYNHDDTAARHAIRLFGEQGLTVGDNQPYSGKQLNATMDRHAEANGIPYMVQLLGSGPQHPAATDAAATLTNMSTDDPSTQDAVREAGGIRPLIAFLSAHDVDCQGLIWAARCLRAIARNNTANRNVICEQQGTITQLVTLLGNGAASEGAREAAEVLACLMAANDDRIAVAVLAACRRQGVGIGANATFALADEFPEVLEGLQSVVGNRLIAAVKKGSDRTHVQLALNDAIALDLPQETLDIGRTWLSTLAATRTEAATQKKKKSSVKKDTKKVEEERASAKAARAVARASRRCNCTPTSSASRTACCTRTWTPATAPSKRS